MTIIKIKAKKITFRNTEFGAILFYEDTKFLSLDLPPIDPNNCTLEYNDKTRQFSIKVIVDENLKATPEFKIFKANLRIIEKQMKRHVVQKLQAVSEYNHLPVPSFPYLSILTKVNGRTVMTLQTGNRTRFIHQGQIVTMPGEYKQFFPRSISFRGFQVFSSFFALIAFPEDIELK